MKSTLRDCQRVFSFLLKKAFRPALAVPAKMLPVLRRVAEDLLTLCPSTPTETPPPCPQCLPPLTRRETEVLHHMSLEGSYEKIARSLGVAPQTITTHRDHIFRKLGVHCRLSAVKWYLAQGKASRGGE